MNSEYLGALRRIRSSAILALATAILAACSQPEEGSRAPAPPYAYPLARAGDHVDEHHGLEVPDPYRALEDPAAPETRAWVDAQNELTRAHLESVTSLPAIRARLAEVWNHERYGVPLARGGRYFFTRNDGLQNQSVLLVAEGLRSEPRVLLDPNALSADGTTALSGVNVSDDGKLLAYGISKAGSDWQEWRVREVASAADLPDVIRWVKFSSASWTKDGAGFFYSRYDEPKEATRLEDVNYFQKLYYHRLGTPQSDDVLVHHAPGDKELGFDGDVTEDGRYLVIMIRRGSDPRRRVAFKELDREGASVVDLVSRFEAAYDFLGNEGPVFWFLTDLGAPRGRIVALDTRAPGRIVEVVPQAAETLMDAEIVGERFIASYLEHASTRVRFHRLDGSAAGEVALPGLGAASGFTGRRADTETFYSFTSFTTPTEIHRLDLRTGEDTVFHRPRVAFDRSAYETSQSFYASKDGTRVPIFVTHRKGLVRDGGNPTLLYGYGGFNIPITPSFSPSTLVWLEMGGVYAVANLRGGGEYGEEWHEAGTKLKKQNVFDDFIAASEWLIREKITSTPRLAITGRSNGGLLAGACITQRPELFGAAIVDVGVLDMLRFHKFTIGWAWVSDFGSADEPREFEALLAYSPYHNVRKGTAYPATLITTADHDDRVVPAHSYKFAAALQAGQGGPEPILLRVDTKSGHGAGKPTSKLIEEAADKLAFLVKELGVPQAPPSPPENGSHSPRDPVAMANPAAIDADRDREIISVALRDLLVYTGEDSPVAVRGSPPPVLLVDPRPCRWRLQEWDIFRDDRPDTLEGLADIERIDAREAASEICSRLGTTLEPFFLEPPDPRIRLVDAETVDPDRGPDPFERPITAWPSGRSGRLAVVCLHVPWSTHHALGNFLLVEEEGSWRVRLRQFVYYP